MYEISIHVPNAGNDWHGIMEHIPVAIFQSTFPMQGTTEISTSLVIDALNFNPRSQCRERRVVLGGNATIAQFQSTFPMQGTTIEVYYLCPHCKEFQSTFPMQGTTGKIRTPVQRDLHFNPRSQCRERQQTYPNINLKQHYICNILRFSFNIFSSLIYIVIQYSIFVQLFWCESPGIFMYTSYSHYQIAV